MRIIILFALFLILVGCGEDKRSESAKDPRAFVIQVCQNRSGLKSYAMTGSNLEAECNDGSEIYLKNYVTWGINE